MKSPNLDRFYLNINKTILLFQSYLEMPEIGFIIKSCRLKPYSFFFENNKNKLSLQSKWFDEYGNSLTILKKKKVKIICGDLQIDKSKILCCTDMYSGLTINNVAKISKTILVNYGYDDEFYQDCFLISFLGIDNYLRTYLYMFGELKQISSLLIGLRNLKSIHINSVNDFREFKIKENNVLPCQEYKTWLSSLPMSEEFSNILEKQCPIAFQTIKTNKGMC